MKYTYTVQGMTCQSCKAQVTNSLEAIDGVTSAIVDLDQNSATVMMKKHLDTNTLQNALASKYTITDIDEDIPTTESVDIAERSKLVQLKPLFIILFYIAIASILLHKENWNVHEMMVDFMGLFFIVFSFFKMLDINGFATSFSMYDPIAKKAPIYALAYPFIETILGLMLLLRFNIDIALITTIIVLGFTTFGVTKTLLSKRSIKCACLGTALDLPMTEATFIENTIMIAMSLVMLSIF